MRRVEGSADVRLLECTNPVRNRWRLRWDVQKKENGSASYMEEEFDHRPTEEEIRETIVAWVNDETDRKILSGFRWKGMPVWLSMENQMNYARIERCGAEYPLRVKMGEDEEGRPVYHTFEGAEEFGEFSEAASRYVMEMVSAGWREKDAVGDVCEKISDGM